MSRHHVDCVRRSTSKNSEGALTSFSVEKRPKQPLEHVKPTMAISRLALKQITRARSLSAHAHAASIASNNGRAASDTPERALKASAHAASLDRSATSAQGKDREDLDGEHGNMPGWAQDNLPSFWQVADTYERANGRRSSERLVSIPRERAPHDRLELVREFVQDAIGERHPYAFAMHNSRACDGGEQPHAPMMFSTRTVDGIARGPADFFPRANTTQPALGGAAKDTTWYAKSTLHDLRRDWADIANRS